MKIKSVTTMMVSLVRWFFLPAAVAPVALRLDDLATQGTSALTTGRVTGRIAYSNGSLATQSFR